MPKKSNINLDNQKLSKLFCAVYAVFFNDMYVNVFMFYIVYRNCGKIKKKKKKQQKLTTKPQMLA